MTPPSFFGPRPWKPVLFSACLFGLFGVAAAGCSDSDPAAAGRDAGPLSAMGDRDAASDPTDGATALDGGIDAGFHVVEPEFDAGKLPPPTDAWVPEPEPDGLCESQEPVDELPPIEWRVSLQNGSEDADGHVMSSTEVRSFAVMDGKLFAAQGIWMDPDDAADDQPGPQILVLDRAESEGGAWRVDFELEERVDKPMSAKHMAHRYTTFSTMRTLRFETDADGAALDKPVELLIASVWDKFAEMNVFVRDADGTWTTQLVEPGDDPPKLAGCRHHVRSFVMHRDAMTGADLVFAGTNAQGADCPTRIYRGAYDADAGEITWSSEPEGWTMGPAVDDRVTSMTVVDGTAYATACGKVFRRTDGDEPVWSRIYIHPDDNCPAGPGENGFRGATPVKLEDGHGILMAMEGWQAHIGVLELGDEPVWHNEVNTNDRLGDWLDTTIGYSIVAYDDMLRFTLPGCSQVTLMGLEANTPISPTAWNGWARRARYFVRYEDGRYENRRLHDDTLMPQPLMVAVRTLVTSPFPEDEGLVIYAGGFDANHVESDDTGWLYRGTLQLD